MSTEPLHIPFRPGGPLWRHLKRDRFGVYAECERQGCGLDVVAVSDSRISLALPEGSEEPLTKHRGSFDRQLNRAGLCVVLDIDFGG